MFPRCQEVADIVEDETSDVESEEESDDEPEVSIIICLSFPAKLFINVALLISINELTSKHAHLVSVKCF